MAETWDTLEDWEEWTPESGVSLRVHAMAGSMAGAAEHGLIFPLDTMRTLAQAEGSKKGVVHRLVHREGLLRLWRGVSTILPATIPAHAIYFSVFEQSKVAFGANDHSEHTPLAAAACGALATLGHDMIMTPMDVIKQRLQLGMHSGMLDCGRTILQTEGPAALFRSLPTTLLMNIPFAGVMVAANESFKRVLNPSNEYNLPAFFLSGGLAGAVAAAATTPLDVIKTRLQTQSVFLQHAQETECCLNRSAPSSGSAPPKNRSGFPSRVRLRPNFGSLSSSMGVNNAMPSLGLSAPIFTRACRMKNNSKTSRFTKTKGTTTTAPGNTRPHSTAGFSKGPIKYKGFLDTAQRIYQQEGLQGFTRGVRPRVMVFAPSVAISWTTYETAKNILAGTL